MKELFSEYWFIIIGWPLLAALISWIQLPGGSSPTALEWTALLLGYLIVGLVAGWLANWILQRQSNFGSLVGFGVATPVAYLVSLHLPAMMGWASSWPQLVTFIFLFPLTIGVSGGLILLIGTRIGALLDRQPPMQKIN